MFPKVSIILPAYNHASFVKEAVFSCLNQTFEDFELIIGDDCSTDSTGKVLADLARSDDRIVFVQRTQNLGASANHLDLLSKAKGQYLATISSDDVWLEYKLTTQIAIMEKYPDVVGSFGAASFIDSRSRKCDPGAFKNLFLTEDKTPAEIVQHFLFAGNFICHPTALVRREAFLSIGNLDFAACLHALPDFWFWIGLIEKGDFHFLNDPLVKFRIMGQNGNASAPTETHTGRTNVEMISILHRLSEIRPSLLAQALNCPMLSQADLETRKLVCAIKLSNSKHFAQASFAMQVLGAAIGSIGGYEKLQSACQMVGLNSAQVFASLNKKFHDKMTISRIFGRIKT